MEKSMDLLQYFWPQKWQKIAGFSFEKLQILESFSIFVGEYLKIAHNSLNNGVRAVLTTFLDFQFF